MLKQWLAREERRIALAVNPKEPVLSPAHSGITFSDPERVWSDWGEKGDDAGPVTASAKRSSHKKTMSSSYLLREYQNSPRHYAVQHKNRSMPLSRGANPVLPGARLYVASSPWNLRNMFASAVDVVRLSAVLLVSGAAQLLVSIWRLACGRETVPGWKDTVSICSGKQTSSKPTWSRTHRLDVPPFCLPNKVVSSSVCQQTFTMPKASVSVTGVTVASSKNESKVFAKIASIANSSPNIRLNLDIGEVSFPASVSFLVPDDGQDKLDPEFHQIWRLAARAELTANMMQRTKRLFRAESAQQVAAAMNESCNLDWFNQLVQERPRGLGIRSFSLHTGVLMATENATYALTRGDVQLFALKSSGMHRVVELEQQKPIRFAPGKVADSATKKVLRVPHAGNEGTVLVLATAGSLRSLSHAEQHKLFHWASSQDGQGPIPIEMAEPNRIRRDLGPFAAAFVKVMPKLQTFPK